MADRNDCPPPGPHGRAAAEGGTIVAPAVMALYESHGAELRRFILGVVRHAEVADDVMQSTFAKAVELGHTARAESLKGWLFRVAFHEALTARRRQASRDQAHRRLADLRPRAAGRPEEALILGETVDSVRQALAGLPPEQRRVVWARMYEDKSFAEIAGESGLPLGTVLTRMRLALEKLRRALRAGD